MKKIVINCNDCFAAYNFRLNLIKKLQETYHVLVVAGFDEYTQKLKDEKVQVIAIENTSTNKNIFEDFKLIKLYKKIFKEEKPHIIINYTVKPHIYATLVSKRKVRVINVVSGVGSLFLNKDKKIFKIVTCLYRLVRSKVNQYVFLNEDDYQEFKVLGFIKRGYSFLPSEGIDLNKFYPYVNLKKDPTFIFVGRLVKEKGIYEYLEAAKFIKNRYPNTTFLIAGSYYKKDTAVNRDFLRKYEKEGFVKYIGYHFDMNEILKDVHCVVLPSYREGMPISLIEGLASKKVIIAANVIGSKDVVKPGYNGFLAHPYSSYDLSNKIEEYINYPFKEKIHENAYSSSKQYDVNIVVKKMISIIEGK